MTHSKSTKKNINDADFLKQMVQTYLQEYLEQEMALHLGALPYERNRTRKGYRNGYKPRQLNTREGKLFLSLPQDRDGTFSTELFERYQRSERALINCLQEMVIKGVATRKVHLPALPRREQAGKITEALCGLNFSKSQVSDICKRLDTEIQAWLNRPLEDEYPYVLVDARYNKIRRDHKVESHAVLIAKGVNCTGKRDIIGVDVCNDENETNWSLFFKGLKERGLKGVRLVTSDAHSGLLKAIEENFSGCQWQRCQVHFKKNILDKVRNKDKTWVKKKLDDIFLAPDKEEALIRLQRFVMELSEKYPDAADLLEEDGEDALTCLNFPEQHRRRIRTTNSLERFNQEIKRRTIIIRIFPNRNSALRLIGALCMEQAEEWITGRQYLDMTLLEKSEGCFAEDEEENKTKRQEEMVVAPDRTG